MDRNSIMFDKDTWSQDYLMTFQGKYIYIYSLGQLGYISKLLCILLESISHIMIFV